MMINQRTSCLKHLFSRSLCRLPALTSAPPSLLKACIFTLHMLPHQNSRSRSIQLFHIPALSHLPERLCCCTLWLSRVRLGLFFLSCFHAFLHTGFYLYSPIYSVIVFKSLRLMKIFINWQPSHRGSCLAACLCSYIHNAAFSSHIFQFIADIGCGDAIWYAIINISLSSCHYQAAALNMTFFIFIFIFNNPLTKQNVKYSLINHC